MYFSEVFDIKMLVFRIDFIFVGEDIFLFEFSFDLACNDWSNENESNDDKQ